MDAKGKSKAVYRRYATPWEILREMPALASHLKPEISKEKLESKAQAQTDRQAAEEMQRAKQKLFAAFRQTRTA